MNKLSQIYSTIFFIGYIKWAPGTFGTLASLIIITLLNKIIGNIEFIIIFIFLTILSIKFIDIYSKSINKIDAKEIRIEEVLTMDS